MSKKSTKKNVNTMPQNSGDLINEKSSCPTRGMIEGGCDTKVSGISTRPSPADIAVTAIIPISNAPLTFKAVSIAIMNNPRSDNIMGMLFLMLPSATNVASLLTTIPAL